MLLRNVLLFAKSKGSILTFSSHVFLRSCIVSTVSLNKPNSVEYHPKISEERLSDSNLFRDFTNTVYHLLTASRLETDLWGAPSHLPVSNLFSRHQLHNY